MNYSESRLGTLWEPQADEFVIVMHASNRLTSPKLKTIKRNNADTKATARFVYKVIRESIDDHRNMQETIAPRHKSA